MQRSSEPIPRYMQRATPLPQKLNTAGTSHPQIRESSLVDGLHMPGILLCATSLAASALTVDAAGTGVVGVAVAAGSLAAVSAAAGAGWLICRHRCARRPQRVGRMDLVAAPVDSAAGEVS